MNQEDKIVGSDTPLQGNEATFNKGKTITVPLSALQEATKPAEITAPQQRDNPQGSENTTSN